MTTSQSPRHELTFSADVKTTRPSDPRSYQPATSARLLALPVALALITGAFSRMTADAVLSRTFVGAAVVLLAWCAAVWASTRRAKRSLAIEILVRKQHWVQACAQATLIIYWAAHSRIVVSFLPFIVAELVFAYAVDCLISWSRRDVYTLGFGPFPVIFSISLFLLFRPEWFGFQLALIVLGFAAKELIRWNRDGRSAHIFNPSSFPLAVVSLVLLATGTTGLTFGNIIANTVFDTPHIHLAIFLVALPGQLLFGVARTTISAAITLYAVGLLYFAATGTYLFYDAYIPPAVLIGMTLLLPDPSTSPRSDLGRILFGALYGLATAVLFVMLERAGAPTFYDKLLPVPLLNLTVRWIDRAATTGSLAALDPTRLLAALTPVRRNVAFASLWAGTFVTMRLLGGVGDEHPGQFLPFWYDACDTGNARACKYAANLTVVYCQRGSGWACNDVGLVRRRAGQSAEREFQRACSLGFDPGCVNVRRAGAPFDSLASARPTVRDFPIVLSGTKPTLRERDPEKLYALACREGWPGTCGPGAGGR